jgi:hypothetical protein
MADPDPVPAASKVLVGPRTAGRIHENSNPATVAIASGVEAANLAPGRDHVIEPPVPLGGRERSHKMHPLVYDTGGQMRCTSLIPSRGNQKVPDWVCAGLERRGFVCVGAVNSFWGFPARVLSVGCSGKGTLLPSASISFDST